MPRINIIVESEISRSPRARQLEGLFDVPAQEKQRLSWEGELPIEEEPWNVGLITGPSGSGKSTIARAVFGDEMKFKWHGKSVIDDFSQEWSMQEIAATCQAVGFNTIPSWLRPYRVLSTGERFRVDLARRLLEGGNLILMDEFTSVVDRQVAQIGSYAVQKFIRKHDQQFVAVSCHRDIIDWLDPDWIFEPASMTFTRRRLRCGRPQLEIRIARVRYAAWQLFAPFHYLTKTLNKNASKSCFALFIGDCIVAFNGVSHQPHPKAKNLKRLSRLVTLPDWQGLGLAFILTDNVAAAYKAIGYRFRTYPAHPALIHSFDRSQKWKLTSKPQFKGSHEGERKQKGCGVQQGVRLTWKQGSRPCAVFEYVGPRMDREKAELLIKGLPEPDSGKESNDQPRPQHLQPRRPESRRR